MSFSKSSRIIGTLLLTLGACAKAPDDGADMSTFNVSAVTSAGLEQSLLDPSNDYSRRSTIRLRACVQDVGYQRPVTFQEFAIRGAGIDQRLATDDTGCLNWQETLEFNYLARETYIPLERSIVAERPHRGSRVVRLAVNPWRKDASAVLDLKLAALPERVSSLSASLADSGTTRLTLSSAAIQLQNDRSTEQSSELSLQLKLRPDYLREALDGSLVRERAANGTFIVKLLLLERDAAGTLSPLSSFEAPAKLANGELELQGHVSLSRLPAKTSKLEAALRLEPVGAAVIEPFEGRAKLPGLLFGGSVELLDLEAPFGELTAANALPAPTEPASCGDATGDFGFYLYDWSVTFGGVLSVTRAEAVPNEVAANIRVCVRNRLDDRPVAGHVFESRFAGASDRAEARFVERATDHEGCVQDWQERIKFDPYAPEGWLERRIEIRSGRAPFAGISRELPVPINPWQQGALFSWDCRKGPAPRAASSERARLEVQDFSYSFLGQSFEVNRELTLTAKRVYQLRLRPMIRREGGLGSGPSYDPIGEGRYRLKVLVLAPKTDEVETAAKLKNLLGNFKYLSSFETETTALRGEIVQEVTLPFDFQEFPLLAGRNQIFIELAPLDGRTGPRAVTATASFAPLVNAGSVTVVSNRESIAEMTGKFAAANAQIAELVKQGRTAKLRVRAAKEGSVASLRAALGARDATPAEFKTAGIGAAELDGLIAAASSRLCKLLPRGARCERVLPLRHIEKVNGRPELLGMSFDNIAVNAGLSQEVSASESQSNSTTRSDSVSLGATAKSGIDLGFFDASLNVSYARGYSWSVSQSVNSSRGRSNNLSIALGKMLSAERLEFTLDAEVRRCVLIKPATAGIAPLHLCATKSRPERIRESWYYIFQAFAGEASPLRDTLNPTMRPWIAIIRGESKFARFRTLLEDSTRAITLERDVQFSRVEETMRNAYERFVNTYPKYADGAFPGVVN
ncbi:MAG: hypothetical protein NDJ89_13440 [Oligoflexia bacterium]|nr:hypothetical protein [Oligoflexia bacterium]